MPKITLNDILSLVGTTHIHLIIYGEGETNKPPLVDVIGITATQSNKYGNLEVFGIDSKLDISKESPITHSVDIRPIVSVMCLFKYR